MGSNNRLLYETATVLDQEYLDQSHDSLVNRLELIVDIEKPLLVPGPAQYIRASDRNKYVVKPSGEGIFYEALLTFPIIKRTVGEFLSPQLEFSQLELTLSNVDGRFNEFLPEGATYTGWIGKSITVKMGLGEVESTYKTIFTGFITDQGGFKRGVSSISLVARDRFESINKSFPTSILTTSNFPNLESDVENAVVPIIYGDWTVNVEPGIASVPALVVNGASPTVNGDTDFSSNIQLVIANHGLVSFDTTQVYLKRGEKAWRIATADITAVSIAGPGVSSFEIDQDATDLIPITPDAEIVKLEYGSGDKYFVKVKGKSLGAYNDNLIEQAKDILKTFGGMVDADFDANWATLRDKATPTESAISTFKSRVWIQEPENTLEFALSLLEQVRVEAFIDRNLKLKLLPIHLDTFQANPSFRVRNLDVEQGSLALSIDQRTNFNRAKGFFNFLPNRKENLQETKLYRNQLAIDQAGKEISKKVIFPNLYEEAVVINQVKETLRVTSSYLENCNLTLTWRSMLLDVGDFVKLNVQIQSTIFNEVPALIREIGYDPAGMKIPLKLWSFQMLPFTGYNPGNPGTVGGSTATIDEET